MCFAKRLICFTSHFDQFRSEIRSDIRTLVQLIESQSQELHQFREETRSNFQRIEQVTRRHSTSITAGTISIAGFTKAIERIEGLIHDRDKTIAELQDRVRALEQKPRP
ncbi:MAG: hypothetical protein JO307_12155 [Bryobacterales bacterium]|nr:hypothetical protein [Bryobacterales bacterium]MBV9398469.1 hypothetical protein [Bryobacterales bacterium]